MSKKKLWLGMALSAALLVTAGCGTKEATKEAPKPSTTESITVSAAASLQGAMEELKGNYVRTHHLQPDQIAITYGGSGTLRQQIEQGAPSSIFISANQNNMNQLKEKQLVEEVKPLVENALVLIVPKGKEKFNLSNVVNAKRVAIGMPDTVPAGKYAFDALTNLNLWPQVEPKVVYGKDVKAVGAYVAQSAADVGFVYRTDAMALKDSVEITETVPSNLHKPILYPIGVVTKNKNTLTKDFYGYLRSKEAEQILQKHGFSAISEKSK